MSVAFAAPRQRGKGEITPAAIQKVKPRGVGDARPCPRLGGTRGPGRESAGLGAEAGLLGGGWVWEPEPRAAPEWVAEGGEPVLSRSSARVWAPSYRHKSPSNWRPISLGMGRRSRGGARAPGGGGRARRAVFRGPRPPRVAPELLWRRPAPRAEAALCRPHVGSPGARGEAGALLSPRAELQTPAELGSSHQNLGDAAGNLSRGSGAGEGEPSGFRGSLGVPPPFRMHPLPLQLQRILIDRLQQAPRLQW